MGPRQYRRRKSARGGAGPHGPGGYVAGDKAARAWVGFAQGARAALSGGWVPTVPGLAASDGVVRGNVDSLMKLVGALQDAGIELIADGAVSGQGGRGVRLVAANARRA